MFQMFSVLVVPQDLNFTFAIGFQFWTLVILHKLCHFLGRKVHAFPIVVITQGFVFHRKAPNVNSFILIGVDILGEELILG